MITFYLWSDLVGSRLKNPWSEGDLYVGHIVLALIFSIPCLIVDLLLSPFELLAFVIYKIIN